MKGGAPKVFCPGLTQSRHGMVISRKMRAPRPGALFSAAARRARGALPQRGHCGGAPHTRAREVDGKLGSGEAPRQCRRICVRVAGRLSARLGRPPSPPESPADSSEARTPSPALQTGRAAPVRRPSAPRAGFAPPYRACYRRCPRRRPRAKRATGLGGGGGGGPPPPPPPARARRQLAGERCGQA